jgi:hypothetical protein
MTINNRQDYVIIDLIQQAVRNVKAQPFNLGGISGTGGGLGGPPGGFIGLLAQSKVAYDTDEAAYSGILSAPSGTLIDNLAHLRYRLNALETGSGLVVSGGSITVIDDNTPSTYNNVDTIHFSGAGVTVANLGSGDIRVSIISSGGTGTPLTVQEQDGSPIISNVDKIIFSGATVTDLGSGDVLVAVPTPSGFNLIVADADDVPSISNVDKIVFSGALVEDLGSGDVRVTIPTVSGFNLAVGEQDGSPVYTNVDKILFSGAAVSDLGNGDVLVAFSGGGSALTVMDNDTTPTVNNVDKIIFSGFIVTDLGNGDVEVAMSGYTNGHVIEVEDSPFAQRRNLNFTGDVTGSDDSIANTTVIGIPGLRVREQDGNPSIFPVHIITFSGATLTNPTSDEVLVQITTGSGGAGFNDAEGDPNNTSTTFSDGTSIYAARRDHVHAHFPADFINSATAEDPLDGDYFGYRKTSGGTYRKLSWSSIKSLTKAYFDTLYTTINTTTPNSGWVEISDSWSYASSTTITIPSDGTTVYQVGDRIRLKQGGAYKYFVVTAVTATLLTVYAGSDNTVANSAITNMAYSRAIKPYGFPGQFNFTPSWVGGITVGNATIVAKVMVYGNSVKGNVSFKFPASGVTCAVTGQITLNPPITILSSLSTYTTVGAAACVDWATALYMGETVDVGGGFDLRIINASATYAYWAAPSSTVPFTWGADDLFTMEFNYFI